MGCAASAKTCASRGSSAHDWLESCQNEDGGWGETCTSYDDPTLKGRGPSTPSQTAWALMGLIAATDSSRPAAFDCDSIRRGIEFLIARQNADGSWPEPETTGTGFPCVFYLKYDMPGTTGRSWRSRTTPPRSAR